MQNRCDYTMHAKACPRAECLALRHPSVLQSHSMEAPSRQRATQVEELLRRIPTWSAHRPDIRAIALVGSWARGAARQLSDVDLVLLTIDPGHYLLRGEGWIRDLGVGSLIATRLWGAITERRTRLPSGLEVDVGVGLPSWAELSPLDQGTLA